MTSGVVVDRLDKIVLAAGVAGVLGAVFVGTGEFLLHFTPNGGITDVVDYRFFEDIPAGRLIAGHFLGVLTAPLYLLGYWHIYRMLRPGGFGLACAAFLVGSYAFCVGGAWIGERAFLGLTVHEIRDGADISALLHQFSEINEPFVNVLRAAMLFISVIWVFMILHRPTHYPRWLAVFSPILILSVIFICGMLAKPIELYVLPIAMNVTHFIVFGLSTLICAQKLGNQ